MAFDIIKIKSEHIFPSERFSLKATIVAVRPREVLFRDRKQYSLYSKTLFPLIAGISSQTIVTSMLVTSVVSFSFDLGLLRKCHTYVI